MYYPAKKDEVKELRDKIRLSPEGAYLFWGEEEYLKHYYLGELRKIIADEGMEDFNRTVLDFRRDDTLKELEEAIDSLPVMASHKIVEVWGMDILDLKKEGEKKLVEIVKKVSDGVILVIFARHSELEFPNKKSRERKIVKELEASLTMVEFPRQSEQKLLSWTDKLFRTAEVRISDVNITKMIKLCDFSMTRLKNEADKLISYCKFNKLDVVPNEIIDVFVKPCAENETYEFTEAVVRRSLKNALEILENLRLQNVEAIALIAMLGKALSGLATIKSARGRMSDAELSAVTGFFPWQIKKYEASAEYWSEASLRRALELTFDCEGDLKSTTTPSFVLIESLVTAILEVK